MTFPGTGTAHNFITNFYDEDKNYFLTYTHTQEPRLLFLFTPVK